MPAGLGARNQRKMTARLQAKNTVNNNEKQAQDMTVTSYSSSLASVFFTAMLFLPSITFNMITAEIFPWGVLYYFFNKSPEKGKVLILSSIFAFSWIIGLVNYGFFHSDFLRSFLAYFNAILPALLIVKLNTYKLEFILRVARIIFWLLILVAILQITIPSSMSVLTSFFLRRGSYGGINSFRGVSLLSSEPSRASLLFLYLFILIRETCAIKQRLLFTITFLIVQIFLIKSATGVVLTIIYFTLIYKRYIPVIIVILSGLIILQIENRALNIISGILSSNSFDDIFHFLINNSGFRLTSILSAYSTLYFNPLGYGIGYWFESSMDAIELVFPDYREFAFWRYRGDLAPAGIRPTALGASLCLDMGYLGFTFLIMLVRKFIGRNIFSPWALVTILSLFFVSAIGSPLTLLIPALISTWKK